MTTAHRVLCGGCGKYVRLRAAVWTVLGVRCPTCLVKMPERWRRPGAGSAASEVSAARPAPHVARRVYGFGKYLSPKYTLSSSKAWPGARSRRGSTPALRPATSLASARGTSPRAFREPAFGASSRHIGQGRARPGSPSAASTGPPPSRTPELLGPRKKSVPASLGSTGYPLPRPTPPSHPHPPLKITVKGSRT